MKSDVLKSKGALHSIVNLQFSYAGVSGVVRNFNRMRIFET